MLPTTWSDFLAAPAFVINLDRRPDRWTQTEPRIRQAGFTDIRRYAAVDGQDADELATLWRELGSPRFDPQFAEVFTPGHQACFLSHMGVWGEILDADLPFALIFEDDIRFHSRWSELGPLHLAETPMNADQVYLGGNMQRGIRVGGPRIVRVATFTTHAYAITRSGIEKLLVRMENAREGFGPIDTMFCSIQSADLVCRGDQCLHAYFWDALDEAEINPLNHTVRNRGLVVQELVSLGTDTDPGLQSLVDQVTGTQARDTERRPGLPPRNNKPHKMPRILSLSEFVDR